MNEPQDSRKALRIARLLSWTYLVLGIGFIALGVIGVLGVGGRSRLPYVDAIQIAVGSGWIIMSFACFARVRKWTAQESSNAS